jgi:predicted RNA-binding protein YlxR (DUF448 family)
MQSENFRHDILSKKSFPKKSLFRLVIASGEVVYDPTGHQPGRGFYLLKEEKSLEKAAKNNLLAHYGGAPVASGLYETLRQAL